MHEISISNRKCVAMAAILSGKNCTCCAIGCCSRYSKDCGISFYRFPKVNPRAANGSLLSEERNGSQLNTFGCMHGVVSVGVLKHPRCRRILCAMN